MEQASVVIVGGGPAGLAAALGAYAEGARDLVVIERDYHSLGGILNQCIHNGFGLHLFKEELTGPEYAHRFVSQIESLGIKTMLDTMVIGISPDRIVTAASPRGYVEIKAGAVVLATGCRERPRGAISIPGARPAGVLTAGTAQKFVNIDGYMPGNDVVVLGSGDIGLIMARRLTLEGAKVRAVVELLPYSNGLKRNVVQCLDDFGIPLLLSHTVCRVHGKERVTGVDVIPTDAATAAAESTIRHIPCDTLLLSVGLIPENELGLAAGVELSPITGGPVVGEAFQTSREGVFSCGNALQVHDLADFVSIEGDLAGRNAARFAAGRSFSASGIPVVAGRGIRHCVPFRIDASNVGDGVDVRFRVREPYRDRTLAVYFNKDRVIARKRRVMTPGEMETVRLDSQVFTEHPAAGKITLAVEEE